MKTPSQLVAEEEKAAVEHAQWIRVTLDNLVEQAGCQFNSNGGEITFPSYFLIEQDRDAIIKYFNEKGWNAIYEPKTNAHPVKHTFVITPLEESK